MHPSPEAPGARPGADPAARAAELERTLVAERARNAARAREVEEGVLVLRRSLQDLQAERKHLRDENARLAAEAARSREHAAALTAARAASNEPALAAALDEARADAAAQARRVQILESALAEREAAAADLAARIADLEAKLAAAAAVLPAAAAAAVVRDSEEMITDDPLDEGGPAGPVPAAAALAAASERNESARGAPPAPDEPQLPGLRIERVVAEGPDGTVLDAREVESRRAVTVRILPGPLRKLDGKVVDSALLAKHPNLVSVLSFAVCRQGPYLVLEREEGETASHWVARIGALPERIALSVVLEAARGLRQAAFHGAHHGDLSPDSILIDVSGRVRVRGAGLRPLFTADSHAPAAPAFAAPERLVRDEPPGVRGDLWSLGAVLWFLLAGRPPFEGDRDAVRRALESGDVPDVRDRALAVSDATAALLASLLARDPERRPDSWDRVLVDLQRLVPSPDAEPGDDGVAARLARSVRRHPWVAVVTVAGLAVAAALWWVAGGESPTVAERWRGASDAAGHLAAEGNLDGARLVLRPFLAGTGDADVERAAAEQYDALR